MDSRNFFQGTSELIKPGKETGRHGKETGICATASPSTATILIEDMRAKHDQERELVERARRGNRDAANLLLRHSMPMAMRMVRAYVQHREDVADVLQAVLISIWKSIRKLENLDAYRAWVARIVHFRVMDHLRRQHAEEVNAPRQSGVELDELPSCEEGSQLSSHIYRLLGPRIEEGISRQEEQYQVVLTLHLLNGKTNQEIATETGKKVGTVKSLVSRGKKRLLTELEAMG